MTDSLLLLGHAGLAAVMPVASFLPRRARAIAVGAAASTGIGLAVALVLARSGDVGWRTAAVGQPSAIVAGAAVAGAWFLVGVLDRGAGRCDIAAYVGVAGTGLALFATNEWAVPALLFWVASSVALALLVGGSRGRTKAWGAIALSDAGLATALMVAADGATRWELPAPGRGWAVWIALAAAVLRALVVPACGAPAERGGADAAVPLLCGGGFAVAAIVAGAERPWAAVALLLASIALGVSFAIRRSPARADAVRWTIAALLAVVWAAPAAAAGAAVAAVLAVCAAVLWPTSAAEHRPFAALALGFVPPLAGAAPLSAAAAGSFDRALGAGTVIDSVPWFVIAGALPAVVGVALLGAVKVARVPEPVGDRHIWPAAAALLLVSAGVGAAQGASGLPSSLGPEEPVAVLFGVAAVVGLVAAAVAWKRSGGEAPAIAIDAVIAEDVEPSARVARVLAVGAALFGVATLGAAGWLTFAGLRTGFL